MHSACIRLDRGLDVENMDVVIGRLAWVCLLLLRCLCAKQKLASWNVKLDQTAACQGLRVIVVLHHDI